MVLNTLQKLFRTLFRRTSSASLPPLPDDPAPSEITARFLVERHFSSENRTVKWKAFEPAKTDHRTSVFRTDQLSEAQVRSLGDEYVAPIRKKAILGRAEATVRNIVDLGLRVEPAQPPPRHANIADWPQAKPEWKILAIELAASAILKLRTTDAAS